ncbi:MAG: flippase-like domain-containing protein [Bacilli bacterium]|nr:flippase-like domain-containing protein [Bacilli bacterium]
MKKNSKLKYFLSILFLILIIFLTFKVIYDKESIEVIIEQFKTLKYEYIVLCFIIMALYYIIQGVYMKIILTTLKQKTTILKCTFYALVECYFSGITPSASGGQPAELIYMTKDKIPMRKSYITLMLNTIYFKLILLVLGIIALIYKSEFLFNSRYVYMAFFGLGFLVDLFVVVSCTILVFNQSFIRGLANKVLNLGRKIPILRKYIDKLDIDEILKRYNEEILFIADHKKVVVIDFFLAAIQRILYFSIAYVVYRALGFNTYTYLDLLSIQVIVQVTMEAVPIPGGAGVSEGMFHNLFVMVFASKLADVGMLLTRTYTFYIPLIVSGLIVLTYNVLRKRKN